MNDDNKFLEKYFKYFRAKDENSATQYDKYIGISGVLRAHVIENWIKTQKAYLGNNEIRRIYYLSLEYNLGSPIKMHSVSNELQSHLDIMLEQEGIERSEINAKEPPMDLGNGFIGEFSANILEVLASKGIPSVAYGLWYGMAQFRQAVKNNSDKSILGQLERPYYWSSLYNPWVVDRPEYNNHVCFGSRSCYGGCLGKKNPDESIWICGDRVMATPVDFPISGYRNKVVNTLRFWNALPSEDFSSDYMLHSDYVRACDEKSDSVKFLRYLFSEEVSQQTSELHIKQQYFLAAASIKDILRRHLSQNNSIETICDKAQIILADSRMGFAIIEFIRILIAHFEISVEKAVGIARKTFVISLPLVDGGQFPKVPLYILETLLPQHVNVIMKINHWLLDKARKEYGASDDDLREISLIEEGAIKKICMANLSLMFSGSAFSYSQSGADHIKNVALPKTSRIYSVDIKPTFSGVSLRRWLLYSNKHLADLITSKIGEGWIKENSKLADFERYSQNAAIQKVFTQIKAYAKEEFLEKMFNDIAIAKNSLLDTLFITHIRKITLGNSQVLMLLYIAARYLRLRRGEKLVSRAYFFTGRALPFDFYGKQLVSLVNIFSRALKDCKELQVHFVYNCTTSLEEELLAIGDMAEFISSPYSLEPSSFSAVRAAANGMVPLSGANSVDIDTVSKIGLDSCFYLENTDKDISGYDINAYVENTPVLKEAFELVEKWIKDYSGGEEEEGKINPLWENLRYRDEMKIFSFFDEYCRAQDKIDAAFADKSEWSSMALRNIARSSAGSLDNTICSLYGDYTNKVVDL
ncbi:MAG: glycogen/starch/alpha-glucan phosphorylase [Chitinivibrionia bacterium]|nr:glycogen/starch/alpha-glucan phosphorylase [Chitinivibrionia bacterium]